MFTFTDQVYRAVTRSSQNKRCFDCKDAWDRLMSLRIHGSQADVDAVVAASTSCYNEKTLFKSASVESGLQVDDVAASSGDESSFADSALSSLRSSPDVERAGVRSLVFGSASEALDWIKELQTPTGDVSDDVSQMCNTQVLVTGSSHLVGCVLGILDPNLNSSYD